MMYGKKVEIQTLYSYSAAEFTFFHANSLELTKFHTFSRNIFFYRHGRQTTLKIASNGLLNKKTFIFPIRGGNMDCFEYERVFVKKPMGGYFERCLPSIPVKKKI
jgi:hypothetical protein